MSSNFDQAVTEKTNYGEEFKPSREVYVIKKDGSKEIFNVQKVVNAVAKSAYRALTRFTGEEEGNICRYVIEKVNEMGVDEIPIPVMHNIVESALEQVKPVVAKSYRDYRNYKQDFVRMLDDVYKKSQYIMYIWDKENGGESDFSAENIFMKLRVFLEKNTWQCLISRLRPQAPARSAAPRETTGHR